MFQTSKIIWILLAAFFLLSCKSSSTEILYPEGGYKYPYSCYKSRGDSFFTALYAQQWYLSYNEPDLTTGPLPASEFRLGYESAFGQAAIFILTENKLVVKQPAQGNPYPQYDYERLDSLESFHFRIMQRNFPLTETDPQSPLKQRNDSLSRLYPQLSDPQYFTYLLNKAAKPDSIPFKYSTKEISLSPSQYRKLVAQVNESGYWKLPRHITCDHEYLDGDGILLEANTPDKFNIVSVANCYEKEPKFSKACQAIIDMAGLGKEIEIVRWK